MIQHAPQGITLVLAPQNYYRRQRMTPNHDMTYYGCQVANSNSENVDTILSTTTFTRVESHTSNTAELKGTRQLL